MQIEGLQKADLYVNSEKNFHFNDFPDELLINFFSYLKIKELSSNVLVSKKFKQITIKTTSSEQLIILKNLVKTFIRELDPNLYQKEIKELKIFCDNKYLSKAMNLIDLKKDLNDFYLILANILKDIPYADLKIEDTLTHEDLVNSQFFLEFVNTLSLLKLEKEALKEADNLEKMKLLKEVALDAVHWDCSDKAIFLLKNIKNLAFPEESALAKDRELCVFLFTIPSLLAKGQFSAVADLLKKLPDSEMKTVFEIQLNKFAPFWNKNNLDLLSEINDLLDVYNNFTNEIYELKQDLINQDNKYGILAKFLKKLDLDNNYTDIKSLKKFIAKFDLETQLTLNNLVELAKFYKKKRSESVKSLDTILHLLSARNLFNTAIEIIANSPNFRGLDKLPWNEYILLNSPITFSLDYLDKIPIQAAYGALPRQRCFTMIITRFIKRGYLKKALTLSEEYDQKYKGEMMVDRCKEIIKKYKSL